MRMILFLFIAIYIQASAQESKTRKLKPNAQAYIDKNPIHINPACKLNYKIPKDIPFSIKIDNNIPCADSIGFFKLLKAMEEKIYE
ncbi:MAG: hypothetical protein KA797_08130 [Chitinophagales bacterium]|nr:hypothetical protein [Chitinophagales bacterium]